MENSLPYTTDYAKSSRAKCKGCKSTIEKECLRLAVMVQSAFHDGKQPNWFHMKCFFLKQRPKSVGDITNFEKLRHEDQEAIKENVEKSSSIVVPSTSKGGSAKSNKRAKNELPAGLKDFGIEYSKSARAGCVGCEQKIAKDIVRIKKMNYESEVGMKYGGQPMWHHLECFVDLRDELGYFESGVSLPGFKSLSKDDQAIVKKLLPPKECDVPNTKKLKMEPKDETDFAAESAENEKIKSQNARVYEYRDQLKPLDKQELAQILTKNKQQVPVGIDNMMDAIADMLTFGALLPCSKCKGQFELSKAGYVCQGNLSEWVKCLTVVKEPPRVVCKIGESLKTKYPFLKKYKCEVSNRIIKYIPSSIPKNVVKKEEGITGPKVKREKPKLYNMQFVIVGKTKHTKEELTKIVTKLGGTIKTRLHSKTAAVISNSDEVEKMNKRMQEVKNLGIHVVDDSYFDALENGDAIALLTTKTICDWGTDPTLRIEAEVKERESIYTKNMPSKVVLKLKDGGAVDPDSKLQDTAHIYESDGVKYNCVLSKTDIQSGKNSFYKMQILKSDHGNKFWLFRSWGRIGTKIGNNKLENLSVYDAIMVFQEHYLEKTGNDFDNQSNFVKKPGCYIPIDIDYSDDKVKSLKETNNIKSKLEKPTEELIKLLFDIDMMKKTLLEFELDTVKMPLGKLSKKQMESAYKVLTKLSELITSGGANTDFIAYSNQFYSLIPHSCGIELPPILDTTEMIKNKTEMLDSMMEIELAYSLLNAEIDESINPVDAHYAQLNTDMVPLDHKSPEFEMLVKYVKTTHAETHKSFDLEVLDIFKVKRKGEERRYKPFKKFHNRKLLWHGSRLTNFVGILSHGLKIAPPEAPSTGYMFGKGIYFADMVSKSANYCCTNYHNSTGLMLLCEVALGDMLECKQSEYITKLPKNKHSTKGIGKTQPDPSGSYIREDGVEIPYGKPINAKIGSSLLYNEYIVYDVAQVNVQYLLKMNFKY